MENSYRNIGKVVSVFGLKGEVIVQHSLGKKIMLCKIKVLFLEQIKDAMLPYFVENIRKKGADDFYLKLEDVHTKETASKFLRRDVWMKEEEVKMHTQKNNPIAWVGYRILDQGKDLGPIVEVIEQPHQILCRLEINAREVLVPINEQTLLQVDHTSKSVLLSLPDGLLEVYLG